MDKSKKLYLIGIINSGIEMKRSYFFFVRLFVLDSVILFVCGMRIAVVI